MTMPKMSGLRLAEEILQIRSDQPIVMCTGFSEVVDEGTAKASGICEFVMKPVRQDELAKVLVRALAQ